MYIVYVLKSVNCEKIYIGFTSDLEKRIVAHNHPANSGWTKNYMPWEIIYTENFETKNEALKREKQLKSFKGREFIYKKVLNKEGLGSYPPTGGRSFESGLRN